MRVANINDTKRPNRVIFLCFISFKVRCDGFPFNFYEISLFHHKFTDLVFLCFPIFFCFFIIFSLRFLLSVNCWFLISFYFLFNFHFLFILLCHKLRLKAHKWRKKNNDCYVITYAVFLRNKKLWFKWIQEK